MERACNQRTFGRRPSCEQDLSANVEAIQRIMGDFGGTVYFVDPNHARASNQHAGTDPSFPLRTVAYALTLCSAYTGDVIAVLNNSYWTYGNTAVGRATPIREAVTVNVPGVRIVGVSKSPLGVPWVPTGNNAECITVAAMDVEIEGFNFWEDAGYTGTTGILAQWDGPPYGESLNVHDCYFYDLAYGIQLDYTWNCIIRRCRFDDISTAAIHNPSVFGEPDYLRVLECEFVDNTADINLPDCDYCLVEGNTFMDVTAAIVMTNGDNNTIATNSIEGAGGGANNFINLTGGSSNLVCANMLACTIAQYDTTCSDATSGAWVSNHCTDGSPVAPPT
jgi:parallel beta-helix repeat protein